MDTMLQIARQEALEEKFSRKKIDKKIRDAIMANPDMLTKIDQGVQMVEEFCSHTYYPSKDARVNCLKALDLRSMVQDIFVAIAHFQQSTMFSNVCAQVASRLGFDDRRAAVLTISELLAILCETDAFDITKDSPEASLMLISRIPLGQELVDYIMESAYLPPMVCTPLPLQNNYSSGYLTHKESIVLGPGNHHDGDLCLDVLNTVNQVALQLDTEFLSSLSETPKKPLETAEQRDNWDHFVKTSYRMYGLIATLGNRFYLTNRVDKRGRMYAQGYHISTQGSPFKKAMIELANEEPVTGVPA